MHLSSLKPLFILILFHLLFNPRLYCYPLSQNFGDSSFDFVNVPPPSVLFFRIFFVARISVSLWLLFPGLTLKPVNGCVGQKLAFCARKDKI